jgi:hypothetical protein
MIRPLGVSRSEDACEAGADAVVDADRRRRGRIPEPPASTERPKTYSVRSPITSMSASLVAEAATSKKNLSGCVMSPSWASYLLLLPSEG